MSKLTSQQKEFLKGIPNKKARQEQKIQFKLQNSYNGNVVFINGKFETDFEPLANFMSGHPMIDIMFKDDFEEINGKGKTWYETSAKEVEEKFNKKVVEGILSGESNLTKEVLNDLTNPIKVKNRIEIYTLEELSQFEDLTLKEVNDCLYILYQMQTNDASSLLLKIFMNIKDKIINPEKKEIIDKSNNNNTPMEFCVEIAEDNKEVLYSIWSGFHKGIVNLSFDGFLHSNSLITYLFTTNTIFNSKNSNVKLVSTEDFLRYIGKEDLIKTTESKPLEFDLQTNKDIINYIECLSIQDIIDSRVLIESSPLCQNLKNHLVELVNKKTNPFNLKEEKSDLSPNKENYILEKEYQNAIINFVDAIKSQEQENGGIIHGGYEIHFKKTE